MRSKFITLTLLLVGSLSAIAQQALFSSAAVKSPEINPDNSVTFRLYAPKAVTVELTGDFLPEKTPVVKMTEDSAGVWSFTSDILEPELYSYCFFVNGMRYLDPSNMDKHLHNQR